MSEEEPEQRSTVLVVIPAADDPVAQGVEEPHITLAYLNDGSTPMDEGVLNDVRTLVSQMASVTSPFQMGVSGSAYLGKDRARVLLLESEDLRDLRDALVDTDALTAAISAKQYPFYIPHMTLGYDGTDLPEQLPETVSAAALGLWVQGEHEVFEFGEDPGQEMAMNLMVPVASSADLDVGIRVAQQYPAGRWYVTKRACALGLEHRLPTQWNVA